VFAKGRPQSSASTLDEDAAIAAHAEGGEVGALTPHVLGPSRARIRAQSVAAPGP